MTKIAKTIDDWKNIKGHWKNQSIGFVPTMGYLHKGHFSLIEASQKNNQRTVVSIFVNPKQFNNPDDYQHYPSSMETDIKALEELGVDCVFCPSVDEIYPHDGNIYLSEQTVSSVMEGSMRPGHFDGVLTVIMKLLIILQPTSIYMGEKDYQQYLLIHELAASYFIPTQVICCPTIRDERGVAYSSRNARLSQAGYQLLCVFAGMLPTPETCEAIRKKLETQSIHVEYIEERFNRRFAAIQIEGIRLIDNIQLPKETC